jgi:pseudouridine-5'-phosphate glycosidase
MKTPFIINPEVEKALQAGQPVVALESTIISHGMPYPTNYETALAVEKAIRQEGAVPATIGIIDGVPVIGLTPSQIHDFGTRKGIVKVSRRDLPLVATRKQWGSTTVAATMILAHAAGIDIFVTGGIGGVHRDASETLDISADLEELGKTPVTVVCAGIKSILDLPKTLEYLETKGVLVLGYQSENLAAFYTTDSGIKLDYSFNSLPELADIILAKQALQLQGGILVSNPIPVEYEIKRSEIEESITQALLEAKTAGIKGKELTPYLLSKISVITKGRSLTANIHLILWNATVGAQLAVALAKKRQAK